MPEALADPMAKWTPAPDWGAARLSRPDWSAEPVAGLCQTHVTGDLDAALSAFVPKPASIGLWKIAEPATIAVRIGRDRALLVSPLPLRTAAGWQAGGWAASDASDAYRVLRIRGAGLRALVAEAVAAEVSAGSPSASTLFAGVPALLYRVGADDARLHIEASLAAYVWRWLELR